MEAKKLPARQKICREKRRENIETNVKKKRLHIHKRYVSIYVARKIMQYPWTLVPPVG